MKKIILVIFSFAIIISIFLYNILLNKEKNILFIGEYIKTDNNIIDFYYDNITYKELIKCIKSNDRIIIKNKKLYLNQLINNSNIIILNINQKQLENKCKIKHDNYVINTNKYLNELLLLINRISNSKIYIINNKCDKEIIRFKINDNIKNVKFINDLNELK